jgi:hypothetical protein
MRIAEAIYRPASMGSGSTRSSSAARFTRDRQPTPAATDLAGEPLFDVLLLGDVAL